MRILYLTDQTYLHGGIEKVLSQKANWFADVSGDEVFIITHNQQQKKPVYPFSEKIKFLDLNINYESGVSYFHPRNLLKLPKHSSALKKAIMDIKPDVVVSCSFGPDFYFLPYLKKGIPKIKEFHSSRFFYKQDNSIKNRLMRKLSSTTEKKYHCIAVLNGDEKEFYDSKRITVIPNPAESSVYRADISAKKILAAGRISPVKNFGDLIKSFAALSKEFPEWELHIFGEDYLGTQKRLQQLIDRFGLADQIKFMVTIPDLRKEMQNYSIYGMTSETECFPMVLLEALSVGLPVISYDSPTGPKHITTHEEDGIIVPYKNLDIFTQKLRVMMSDRNLRQTLSENAVSNASKFEVSKVMQQWKQLFDELTQP